MFAAVFLRTNMVFVAVLSVRAFATINRALVGYAQNTQERFEGVTENDERSFRLLVQMMRQEIAHSPGPDDIWDYLKTIDVPLLELEGETVFAYDIKMGDIQALVSTGYKPLWLLNNIFV